MNNHNTYIKIFKPVIIIFMLLASPFAYAIKFQETIQDWDVYSMKQNGRLVCYTVSQPIEKSDRLDNREAYIIVTKIAKDLYEFNASISKSLVQNQAYIAIKENKMSLVTKQNLAWTQNKESDEKLIALMKSNNNLKLFWNTVDKKNNFDQYSLTGFSKALKKLDEICK